MTMLNKTTFFLLTVTWQILQKCTKIEIENKQMENFNRSCSVVAVVYKDE